MCSERTGGILENVIWVLVTLVHFVLAGYMLYWTVRDWNEYPTG